MPERRRLKNWTDLMLRDHGFLRLSWYNLHQISDEAWRSNQPTPGRVASAAKKGIKTIINLRGPRDDGGWRLENEACQNYGLTLVDFTIRSRAVPDAENIHAAKTLFESVEYPILMHCKSGADRAGIMAALYLLLRQSARLDEALKQLSFKYLHVRQAKTGLLDAFLETYRPFEVDGMPFMDWVDRHLDPTAITNSFQSKTWANRLVDSILRRE
ncbi:MAG: tyrosine-protein phosphatase [Alphaproteobacteria bacterium]|nr:tyrosine-protein phosphatase [Alphaproteobacteria bacterium]